MDIASDSPQGARPNARSIIRASPFMSLVGLKADPRPLRSTRAEQTIACSAVVAILPLQKHDRPFQRLAQPPAIIVGYLIKLLYRFRLYLEIKLSVPAGASSTHSLRALRLPGFPAPESSCLCCLGCIYLRKLLGPWNKLLQIPKCFSESDICTLGCHACSVTSLSLTMTSPVNSRAFLIAFWTLLTCSGSNPDKVPPKSSRSR